MTAPARHSGRAERWHTLSIAQQLANVGSEVERALRAHAAGQSDRRDAAMDRALELFDLTAADPRWGARRRREVLRAREFFCALFFGDPDPGAADVLRAYCLQLGILARR